MGRGPVRLPQPHPPPAPINSNAEGGQAPGVRYSSPPARPRSPSAERGYFTRSLIGRLPNIRMHSLTRLAGSFGVFGRNQPFHNQEIALNLH